MHLSVHCLCKWNTEVAAIAMDTWCECTLYGWYFCVVCHCCHVSVTCLSVIAFSVTVVVVMCYYSCKDVLASVICSFYEQDESESSEHILLHFIIYLLCDILLCSKSKQLCVSCLLSLLHIYCLFTLSFVLRCSWLHTSNVMPSVMPSSVLHYGILFCWCYNMKWMQCSRPIGRKWNGEVFCKKKWKMGVFFSLKKVENEGCFCKINVDLSSTQGALCTVSVLFILHFTYLGVHMHPTHPPPAYGPVFIV